MMQKITVLLVARQTEPAVADKLPHYAFALCVPPKCGQKASRSQRLACLGLSSFYSRLIFNLQPSEKSNMPLPAYQYMYSYIIIFFVSHSLILFCVLNLFFLFLFFYTTLFSQIFIKKRLIFLFCLP